MEVTEQPQGAGPSPFTFLEKGFLAVHSVLRAVDPKASRNLSVFTSHLAEDMGYRCVLPGQSVGL